MLARRLLLNRTPQLLVSASVHRQMVKQGPRPLVICGPSGSGKSTLLKRLMDEFPDTFGFSVSHTTRKPRPGEEHGVHYFYVSREELQRGIKAGEFLETAEFSGNLYGTSIAAVEQVQAKGKVCVLDIEIEGVKQIKNSHLDGLYVFIEPPSIDELERRLRGRQTETPESLQMRLDTARREIVYGTAPGNFDFVVHNADLAKSYPEFRDCIVGEIQRQIDAGVQCSLARNKDFKL